MLDLGIPFKIIESRERVGGRLFTYTFPNETGAPNNFYDVGAMRFPRIISMRRLRHLFDYGPLNRGSLQLRKKLTPYYFSNPNALMSYNGETYRQSEVQPTSFQHEAVIKDVDPTPYIKAGYKRIINDIVDPFASQIYNDLENNETTGWKHLMDFDHYSARAYMHTCYFPSARLQQEFGIPYQHLSVDVVNWMETFDDSTGAYDRAFSEIVLETIAFGWNPQGNDNDTEWYCVQCVFRFPRDLCMTLILCRGGAFQIADTMYQYIKYEAPDAFVFNKRVTGIEAVKNADSKVIGIDVVTDDGASKHFSHVVTGIPLPVLRTVDLTAAGLNPMQSNALRELTYGPSIKIGMQFRSAWWTTGTNRAGRKLDIVGGQTYADSPLRRVVYPSFGDVKHGETTTLIASYCWTDDAERLGALITNEELKPVLVNLVLQELARIHDLDVKVLRWELLDTHAWSWSHDPHAIGTCLPLSPPVPPLNPPHPHRRLCVLRAGKVQILVQAAHNPGRGGAPPLRRRGAQPTPRVGRGRARQRVARRVRDPLLRACVAPSAP